MVDLRIPIISNIIEKRSTTSRLLNNTDDPDHTFFKLMFDYSKAGVNVNAANAMSSSVVWRAVTLLSGTIASLPLPVYKRLKPRGKERDSDHPLYYKLHNRPNPDLASNVWRLMGISNQLLWGNWYNEIEFMGGYPSNLWPIPPWRVKPRRSDGGQLYYDVAMPDQSTKKIPPHAMWHVKNLYIDGDEGMSCLRAARESIGLGLAAEEFASRFFGNGANLGGIVEYPGKLKDDAYNRFKESIEESYTGLSKAHRLMFLEEGLKFHRTAVPPNEGQMIEARKFQVADIARFFFITQLHKVGDLERATFSNIEEQGIDFVVDTIQPLLVNIEQEMNHKLFYDAGSKDHFAEFVIDGLLRGNSAARAEYYNKIFQIGGLCVNDILELENRNPIGPEGDERFVPMNMQPLKRAIEEPEEPAVPTFNNEPPEENNREKRSGTSRHRIAKSYKRIFRDAATRIIRRETDTVMRKAKELLDKRSNFQVFLAWLEEFYNKKHPDYVKRQIQPVIYSLAEAIQSEIAAETGKEIEATPEFDKFIDDYTVTYTHNHVKSSHGQLRSIVTAAHEEGVDEIEVLQKRLDEWEERRPDKIADWQTVQVNGAITRFVATVIVASKLVVKNTGNKTCPFCEQLDGRVVGIEQPIIPAGSSIIASDGSGMKIYGKKMNPPFHEGCVCVLEIE